MATWSLSPLAPWSLMSDLPTRCRDALCKLHEQGRIAGVEHPAVANMLNDWLFCEWGVHLDDPGERGHLLALYREAISEPVAWVSGGTGRREGQWAVLAEGQPVRWRDTEAEALVAALEEVADG